MFNFIENLQKPHIIEYRSYKKFSNEGFIKSKISEIHFFNSAQGRKTLLLKIKKKTNDITLKKNAPLKKRSVKANQVPFINKTITKEIMKPSRLTNKETFRNTKREIEKQIKSNGTTALLILEKQNKHSFAILTTLL